jgi:hypothetical protein
MDHKDLEIVRFMLELERLKVWGNLSHYKCLCASLLHKGAKFNPKPAPKAHIDGPTLSKW